MTSFVEFETAADLKNAIEKLDGREFKGQRVTCIASVCYPSLVFELTTDKPGSHGFPSP